MQKKNQSYQMLESDDDDDQAPSTFNSGAKAVSSKEDKRNKHIR